MKLLRMIKRIISEPSPVDHYAPGYINGVKGFYTIGVNNQNGIIYHRQFIKLSNWNNFHFP